MACTSCLTGEIHDEKPTGREVKLFGRHSYVAEPPKGKTLKGTIIFIPDGFGWTFVNNRLLADKYALEGLFRVYIPDFMDGTALPVWMLRYMFETLRGDSLRAWLTKPYYLSWVLYRFIPFQYQNRLAVTTPKVQKFCQLVREQDPNVPLGAAGFCWGGKHAIDLAQGIKVNGKSIIDACFLAHPSFIVVPTDIENVKVPLSIAIGDKDFVLPMSQVKQVQGILKDHEDIKGEVVVYPGAGHGFSVRADMGNEKQKEQAERAKDQAIKLFTESFK